MSRIHYQLANDPALVVDQEVFDRADLTIESMQPVTDDSAATSQMRKNRFQLTHRVRVAASLSMTT